MNEATKKALLALQGRKTQITVAVAMVVALLEAFGIWVPPEWIWVILGFTGMGFMRAGIKNTKTTITQMVGEIEKNKVFK